MTETDWLTCGDPTLMLEQVEGRISDRKLRLFACACVRRIWILLDDQRSRDAVEVAECFADGKAGREELALACAAADRAHAEAPRNANFRSFDAAPHVAEDDLSCSAADAAVCAADAIQIAAAGSDDARDAEIILHTSILRCIFGVPFRPPTIDPAWLTPNVLSLAQTIYDERVFDRMPILRDALEEAGCDNAEILAHCRTQTEHVRGCWVIDSILGKT